MASSQKSVSGVGVSLRREHYDSIFASSRPIDWIEIQPENFMGMGGRSRAVLDRAAERWPIVPHGVALSLGGPDPLSVEYLDELRKLTRRLGSPWFSEHASFAGAGGQLFHDLLPLPFSEEAALHLASRIRHVSDALELPVLIENVSTYAIMPGSTLTEGEFLHRVVEASGARLLLDVNNVFVNATNHGLCPGEALAALPLHATSQIHLGGHRAMDDFLLDDHGSAVCPEVWELFDEAVRRVGPVPTLIEWENHPPDVETLLDEVDRARATLASHAREQQPCHS